jgi:hypothetical protein
MIDEREYKKMEFDPLVKKNIFAVYPKLYEIVKPKFDSKDQKVKERIDKMVRYILLMYDINSPLRKHYPELGKRKKFAADLAGYDLEDVSCLFDFKIKVEDEYEPYNELIDMIMLYLQYQNNWVWTMIVSNEQAFFEYNRRVMMPVDGSRDKDILQAINIKTQIMTSQDEIYQRLQKYYNELSGGDEDLDNAITIRKRLRPEEIANVQSNR